MKRKKQSSRSSSPEDWVVNKTGTIKNRVKNVNTLGGKPGDEK